MVGERIGQYRVHERLGKGGMGAVYRATDETLTRDVALKILETGLDDSVPRLRAEAAALARLSHPGIATVYELVDDGERMVMVMELVRGETLQARLDQVGAFTPRQAATICMDVLSALAHAHASGVVHRDLKPANLMITEGGAIKILDFGIARLDGSVHLTSSGAMVGTPAYMAPEQVLGLPVDQRTDLYAMGVLFYRLVTAALPFKGDTPFAMAQSQVTDPPTAARLLRPDFPAWVDEIIKRALAKAPESRFQSAQEFHDVLAGHLGAEQVASSLEKTAVMERPRETISTRGVAFSRRRVAAALGVGAAALIVVVTVWPPSPATAESGTGSDSDPGSRLQADAPAVSSTEAGANPLALDSQPVAPVRVVPPPALFSNVKLLTVKGKSTDDHEVVLAFDDSRMTTAPTGSKGQRAEIPYARIAKATYTFGRDPKWNPGYSAPAGRIDVPGIMGRQRHWLTVQTPDAYVILRLDGPDRAKILEIFAARTGVPVDSPLPAVR